MRLRKSSAADTVASGLPAASPPASGRFKAKKSKLPRRFEERFAGIDFERLGFPPEMQKDDFLAALWKLRDFRARGFSFNRLCNKVVSLFLYAGDSRKVIQFCGQQCSKAAACRHQRADEKKRGGVRSPSVFEIHSRIGLYPSTDESCGVEPGVVKSNGAPGLHARPDFSAGLGSSTRNPENLFFIHRRFGRVLVEDRRPYTSSADSNGGILHIHHRRDGHVRQELPLFF